MVVGDWESQSHGERGQDIQIVEFKEVCEMQKAELVLAMLNQTSI